MTYAKSLLTLALVGTVPGSAPASAQPGTCHASPSWQAGNNSDAGDQYIGELGENGTLLLDFMFPHAQRNGGYTTFAAPIEGLVPGARYRLHLVFERRRDAREVSLSVAGLRPQSRIVFRQPARQTLQRDYVAQSSRAVVMIHMRGQNRMWSYAGLPRLCRV